jgi:hypothetical protein
MADTPVRNAHVSEFSGSVDVMDNERTLKLSPQTRYPRRRKTPRGRTDGSCLKEGLLKRRDDNFVGDIFNIR